MNAVLPYLIIALIAAALAVAALVWALRERGRADRAELRLSMMETSGEGVRALAAQQAGHVAEELLKRTDQTFRERELQAQQRIDAQLKPVAETLAKFEKQVQDVEKARAEETGGLKQQIADLLKASEATRTEAGKLNSALRRGAGLQGRWGEQLLRNVLELAGLRPGIDFEEQVHAADDTGRSRPDVVVRLAGSGILVLDSKVSLNDYLASIEAVDDQAREAALNAHIESIRRHVNSLSSKAYWAQFDKPPYSRSPDVVVMFVPLEGAIACVADMHPQLVAEAWQKKVAIVTPAALFPLLKAVAYGWRAEDQAKNAREIADAGRELYKRLAVMGGHVVAVGKSLGTAVDKFNLFVGSLERNVLTQARKFEELAAEHQGKPIEQIEAIEDLPRHISKPELIESAANETVALSVVKGGSEG